MPELDAFFTFSTIAEKHCPTYWYSDNTRRKDLSGAWAGSFLAWDILRVCDNEVWSHIKQIPPHMYLFPLIVGVQSIAKPFTELLRLWDFLFCFGLHLNPVVAAAQLIINRNAILSINSPRQLISTILSQLKWMNGSLNARKTIVCTMELIVRLKSVDKLQELWQNILTHATNFEVAQQIRLYHEQEVQKIARLGGTVTSSHLDTFSGMASPRNNSNNNNNNGSSNTSQGNDDDDDFDEFGSLASLGSSKNLIENNDPSTPSAHNSSYQNGHSGKKSKNKGKNSNNNRKLTNISEQNESGDSDDHHNNNNSRSHRKK